MANSQLREILRTQLDDIEIQGLTKRERQIESPQSSKIRVQAKDVINFCANNYLGLANHPEIVDAARLCKAQRFRYAHADLADLERCLKEATNARVKLIATDSVFSMDGDLAKLPEICNLADHYGAAVMIDESHGTGHLGKGGRGAAEALGV